jgi:hypothetical protein
VHSLGTEITTERRTATGLSVASGAEATFGGGRTTDAMVTDQRGIGAFLKIAFVPTHDAFGVMAISPQVRVVIEVGPDVVVLLDTQRSDVACLVGRAADLVEGLTFRATLSTSLAIRVADDDQWLLTGLDAAFDATSACTP